MYFTYAMLNNMAAYNLVFVFIWLTGRHMKRNAGHFSEKTKKLQKQLYYSLLVQVMNPTHRRKLVLLVVPRLAKGTYVIRTNMCDIENDPKMSHLLFFLLPVETSVYCSVLFRLREQERKIRNYTKPL